MSAGLAIISLFVLVSSVSIPCRGAVPEDLFSDVTTLLGPYSPHPDVSVDGAIQPGEYDSSVTYKTEDTNISLSLVHDNDSLFVALTGPTWNWVTIGFSSDNATTMGFVVIARSGSEFSAQERQATSVSASMTLSTTEPDHHAAIEEFEATTSGANSTAELQLSLDSSIWTLQPGVVYPTVVASAITGAEGVPQTISGDNVHFAGGYLLRSFDDVKKMNELFNGKISPVPSLVAAAVISVGIIALFTEFVVRRRAT